MEKYVFNLEFPHYKDTFEIEGYVFSRIEEYKERFLSLQHNVACFGSEYNVKRISGSNQITGKVRNLVEENPAYLEWKDENAKRIFDVLLALTLSTGRDIGSLDTSLENGNYVMKSDHREAQYGGVLRTSISPDMITMEDLGEHKLSDNSRIVLAQKIMDCISNDEWMKKYENGYFLFLLKSAIFARTLESAFLQFWTIWEHLFTVLHRNRYDAKTIQNINSRDKISYLLVEYGLKEAVEKSTRTNITKLATIRNRLVHFGRFPEADGVHDDALFFIRLTEVIIAVILGLEPSNVFNTLDKIEAF